MFGAEGGWLAAAKAIDAVGQFLKSQGVQMAFGEFVPPLLRTNFTMQNLH